MLLGTLGVADEDIVTDYTLTARNLDAIHARLAGSRAYAAVLHRFPPETLHAERETMERVPNLRVALSELAGSMNEAIMRRLNYMVDVEKVPAEEVAAEFLQSLIMSTPPS